MILNFYSFFNCIHMSPHNSPFYVFISMNESQLYDEKCLYNQC